MITLHSNLTVIYRNVNSRHEVTWTAPRYGQVVRVTADGKRGELQCKYSSQRFWFSIDDVVPDEVADAESAEVRVWIEAHERQTQRVDELLRLKNEAAKRGDTFAVWRLEKQLEEASHAE